MKKGYPPNHHYPQGISLSLSVAALYVSFYLCLLCVQPTTAAPFSSAPFPHPPLPGANNKAKKCLWGRGLQLLAFIECAYPGLETHSQFQHFSPKDPPLSNYSSFLTVLEDTFDDFSCCSWH